MNRCLYSSSFGHLQLISNKGFLVYCNWLSSECQSKQAFLEKLYVGETETEEDRLVLDETIHQLNEYFAGSRKEFNLPINLIGTAFQKKVWNLLSCTTYGETISYKRLSQLFGNSKAIRAIAQACGANPVAIIYPCHRIVGANGKLGGYTGGLDKKIALLSLESTHHK